MNFSSRLNRPLLYQEVVSALYQIIDEQKIQPGAQLPSERELIERLGVSRNVLREAFHVMEQRGIIISQQGRGRFLRSLPRNNVQQDKYLQMSKNLERYSLREAYEVRQVLEEKAMELAAQHYAFCPDVDQDGGWTVGTLADELRRSTVWYFWWD